MQNGTCNGALNNSNQSATTEAQGEVKLDTINDASSDLLQGPPPKRRKLGDSSSRSTPRPPSPPWKKAGIDGPTSFFDAGRRRSTRTNAVPPDPHPSTEKRHTRSNLKEKSSRTKYNLKARHDLSSPLSTPSKLPTTTRKRYHYRNSSINGVEGRRDSAQSFCAKALDTTQVTPRTSTRRSLGKGYQGNSSISVTTNGTNDQKSTWDESMAIQSSEDPRRVNGVEGETVDDSSIKRTPRIRFKVKIPYLSPQNPFHLVPLKKYASFREWVENEGNTEDGHRFLDSNSALKEYQTRNRLWHEADYGGLLSKERCSIYLDDPEEEPQQQYSHHDHFIAHALYFKKLLDKEHKHHRHMAKTFAHWCADAWRKRNKRPEDILREQQEEMRQKRRILAKDLQRLFDQARAEVEKAKATRLEEERKLNDQRLLNKALKQSTLLWEKRATDKGEHSGVSEFEHDSESRDIEDDDVDDNEDPSGSESEDEANMSSGSSDSDGEEATADDDADLSPAALRAKYANLPETEFTEDDEETKRHDDAISTSQLALYKDSGEAEQGVLEDRDMQTDVLLDEVDSVLLDESDESIDMDDTEDSEHESSGEDESDEDSGSDPGLLGFFSAKDLAPQAGNDEVDDRISIPDIKMTVDEDDEDFSANEEDDEVHLVPIGPRTDNKRSDSTTLNSAHPPTPSTTLPLGDEKSVVGTPIREPADALNTPQLEHPISPIGRTQEFEAQLVDDQHTLASPTSLRAEEDAGNHQKTEPERLPSQPISPGIEQDELPDNTAEDHQSPKAPSIKTPIPHLLRGTLREYQHFGLDWLAGLYGSNINGILADEMGLGKTIQTIALLAHLAVEHEVWGPHLVIVPTSVMLNWEMEFKKWCPGFKILTYYGTQEERRQKRKGWMDDDRWHVCITSYQLVLQDQQTFKRRNWHYMVLDEAHNIKNFRSQRWQTLLTFKTRARLLLTGTPLQNNLTELWSLLFFLMPNDDSESGVEGFADLRNFSEWFRRPVEQILEQGRETMDEEAKKVVTKLHTVLRPYILRRLKADVEKQMPAKYEHVVTCRLSKRQRYLYDGFMSRAQTKETLASGNYLSIINCLMQLRKVCNHPDLFETRPITTSFAMSSSTIANLEIKDLVIRRRLLYESPLEKLDMDFLNLVPISREDTSRRLTEDAARIMAYNPLRLLRERQYNRTNWSMGFDGSSIWAILESMENTARKARMGELERCLYFESKRHGRRPIYGESLINFLTIDMNLKPTSQQRPRRCLLIDWFSRQSLALESMVLSLEERARMTEPLIQKFACITPAAISLAVASAALTPIKSRYFSRSQRVPSYDPFHEAQMRLSIAFPDKRLLQYDCGKLQQLDRLLRQLQSGAHRALIFTQMTKMLDILEQFLNVHGHRYLRLDGSTKIEQRQLLTERFNNDPRILVFILSSRSGGLGINLTGADTVIFYDLDWNPAMDKQCQDRCHRIGQTRDVHIYRFVSEYTIESNILRKANQKRMLDDVVIQEGEFTTDYFQKFDVRDVLAEDILDGQDEASVAMDRVLDNKVRNEPKVFEEAEDKEDLDAAETAKKELEHVDDDDFAESSLPQTPGPPGQSVTESQANTPAGIACLEEEPPTTSQTLENPEPSTAPSAPTPVAVAEKAASVEIAVGHIDDYLVRFMGWNLKDEPLALPPDKSKMMKVRRGREHRVKRGR